MTEAFPLSWPPGWPRIPEHRREPGNQFRGQTFGRARDMMLGQLRLLGAREVILSTNVPVRIDGLPYAQGRPLNGDPGVAVYFVLRNRQMAMARDAFTRIEANLRSLGLAVEHLRGLERHGGATMLERAFTGFAALPAPGAKRGCWEILGMESPSCHPTWRYKVEDIEAAFRVKLRQHHPDVGGTDEQMAEVNRAREQALQEIGA